MTSEPRSLEISRAGAVLTLTLNRPEALNAFDRGLSTQLVEALDAGALDESVRAIILTGAGRAFSAGQDINELAKSVEEGGPAAIGVQMRESLNPMVLALRNVEKPVIAAVNGYTTGAGLGVALACDIRIASRNATFAMSPFGIGFIPGVGTTSLLPAIVGLGRATELTFMSSRITAARAFAIGMVNQVVEPDDLMAEARTRAEHLASLPTKTIGLTKRAFNRTMLPNLAENLDYEAHLQELAGATEDHREGLRAAIEKRRPMFAGR